MGAKTERRRNSISTVPIKNKLTVKRLRNRSKAVLVPGLAIFRQTISINTAAQRKPVMPKAKLKIKSNVSNGII